jgi:cytochrome c oxidase subunit 3
MNTLVVMFLALLTGITVWWFLIQRLQTKPWIETGVLPRSVENMPAPRVGLRVFFGTMTSIFGVLMLAYTMRVQGGHGGSAWDPQTEPPVLWLNTVLLVLASIAFQRARNAADRDELTGVRTALTAGGALTVLFLLGQLWAWRELSAAGRYLWTGPETGFFYLLTAAHGLHMIGGLVVWARAARKVWQGLAERDVAEIGAIRLTIQLCTVYWHFLLLVWFVMFILLLRT